MQIEERKKRIRIRRNFLFTFIVIVISWFLVGLVIYFLNPEVFLNIVTFILLVFLALFLTLSTVFENTKRGVIYALSGAAFLFLRYLHVGNVLNLILIIGVAISFDLFFQKRQ